MLRSEATIDHQAHLVPFYEGGGLLLSPRPCPQGGLSGRHSLSLGAVPVSSRGSMMAL